MIKKKLAIKGHEERGKEVIELLEMFGGKNVYGYGGDTPYLAYFIENGVICFVCWEDLDKVFILEEFMSEFPYRIGDRLTRTDSGKELVINRTRWDENSGEVVYGFFGHPSEVALRKGQKGKVIKNSEVTELLNIQEMDGLRLRKATEIPELDIEKFQRKEPDKQYLLDCRYMRIALIWAENSYSQRKRVGALIVKDKMIISDGYNGTPSGFENVCEDENGVTKPYVLHAEANAITKIAKTGNSSEGATLYVTMSPCIECAKLIIQSGIRRVVYLEKYRITDGLDLLARTDIEVVHLKLEEKK